MRKRIVLIGAIALGALFVSFDLGLFWSLIAERKMNIHSSGGRYQHSFIRYTKCAIFSPEKTYRRIGTDGWMSEVIDGYWCMSDEDIKEFRERV